MTFEEKYAKVMEGIRETLPYPKIMHGIGGMLHRQEAQWLHRIPTVIGDGAYVELGTHKGRSAVLLGDGMRNENLMASLITVDSFDDRGLSRRFKDKHTCMVDKFGHVKKALEDRGLFNKWVTPVRGLTAETADLYRFSWFDFLFIDAGHDYKNVKADWEAWSPLVRDTGTIAFHDSHESDVSKVLSEIEGWYEFDRVCTLSVWRKNGAS